MSLKKLSKNNCIAIITARGGSKRIKNKNILNFFGKPMISYSIRAAQKTKLFNKIYVSTDSYKIKKIAENFGAEVPFLREKYLSDDYTGTHDVIKNFILKVKYNEFNYVCCIYPTAPLMQSNDIIKGYKYMVFSFFDYVIAVNKIEKFPFKYFKVKNKNIVKTFNKEYFYSGSKNIPEYFQDAGQFYWGTKNNFINKKDFIENNNKVGAVIIKSKFAQDLDNYNDLEMLKFKKTHYNDK